MSFPRDGTPLSRKTFLRGLAGAAAAGILGPLTACAPARETMPGRPAGLDGVVQARVTADLWHPTGKTIQPHLYGYATGNLLNYDCALAANGVAEHSAQTLAPTLIRFNTSQSDIMQSVFANGVAHPDWSIFSRWQQHHADFLKLGGRLVFGIGPNHADTSLPPATWAAYAAATARHFRAIGQEVDYWEVGNECDGMGVAAYSRYFNAVADALHSVSPGCVVGGPVASYWNGIDLRAFAKLSGSRLGFIDFHSYAVGDGDSTQTALAKAASFASVASARKAVKGTDAANLAIGLLEYNMNGFPHPDGIFGIPAQGAITGAVYVALLLTRSFDSDPRFTMGAMWDLVTDSYYGAIGNVRDKGNLVDIDPQGWYLRQAARLLPGRQARVVTSGSHLQVLATASDLRFSLQLVNYNLSQEQSVVTEVIGRQPGTAVERWELSARYPSGHVSTVTSLAHVPVPAQSIVILNGQRHLRK